MDTRWLDNEHPALRRCWHPVARSRDVGDTPVPVRLLGDDWVLARIGGRLAAFADRCPHRLAPLSAGSIEVLGPDRVALRCPYHGWSFDAEGACVAIPSLGSGAPIPPRAAATTPAGLDERDGLVFLAPEAPITDPLVLDADVTGSDRFQVGHLEPACAAVGAGLMADNFLDMSHFPFVHAGTFGAAEDARTPPVEVSAAGRFGLVARSEHLFNNQEDPAVAAGTRPLLQRRRVTYRYAAPFSLSLRVDMLDSGATKLIAFHVQPEDAARCRLYTSLYQDDLGGDEHLMAAAMAYEQKVLDEDLLLQERYRDRRLPLDVRVEVHVKADAAPIALRRTLLALVEAATGQSD